VALVNLRNGILYARLGGYLFAMLRRFMLDLQGPMLYFGAPNPFFYNHNLVFFPPNDPFLLTIIALVGFSRVPRHVMALAVFGVPSPASGIRKYNHSRSLGLSV
jgi:hypothetical protein